MNINEARERLAARLDALAAPIKEKGLKAETRILYTDKNLHEYSEFNEKCILIFGDIAIGTDELERDEFCNYSICCEVKTALVDDLEFEKEVNNLDGEVTSFLEKLEAADTTATALITSINKEQEAEAEKAALDFSKEMNKIRIKLLIGIGVIVVIMLAVIIGIPLLT